ncbi:MAG: GDP-L-fucose synthase family protein [Patescibacteria group bacterium]
MKKSFWKNKTILVTGGAGFLGSHLVQLLKTLNPKKIIIPRSKDYDLREKADCAKLVKNVDIVIHLAANVGGIGYNQEFPGTLFYDNLMMGIHLMEEARKAKVKKFVGIGTICAYPKFTPVPFKEENLWNGYPEETNAPYGLAKKMLLVQAQAYRQQYNFNAIYLLPVNLYGPADNFDPKSSHVIPALIKKFVDAKEKNKPNVEIWGTGKPTREFLYVEDAARAIVLATESYNSSEPVNLGSSFEISIKELAQTIKKVVGYKGKVMFNADKPDGQPRRKLDVSRAKKEFGFESKVSFEEGLKKTVEWYQDNK